MRVCTQPGCTGRIVDGYCDVCGGPAGAAPFVHARSAASAVSPAPAVEAGLTAVGRGSGASARPSDGLMSACTQPGCTGRIVDGYCDVCGSPADAVPFVPATASAASPAFADEPGLAAVPASTPLLPLLREDTHPADPSGEDADTAVIHTRMADPELPTVELLTPRRLTRRLTKPRTSAEDEPDGAQGYRTRVEQAQLPDDVREAALCEVGKLERTSDQSAESGDIRAWLDTILDLPWRTKITDSIDIQGHAKLRRHCGG